MRRELTSLSKYVSYVLRHRPENAGLTLQPGGWVTVDSLISGVNANLRPKRVGDRRDETALTKELLDEIIETNNKKRFEYSPDGTRIRARQGHSVEIDLGLKEKTPPDVLYHGTGADTVDKIRESGIKKMNRHHVHLSADVETAVSVGSRHGKPVVFEVAAKHMHDIGYQFYHTANGVWLVDSVPHCHVRIKK